ncbi:MAG: hypothetical protein WKF41_04210 [Gaiellaceae bacterium]
MAAAVLLSHSESDIRDYLARQLLTDGFEVLNARFGGETLDLAERLLPDLVLVSELDLCARLREGAPGRTWNREVPVIVLGPERADAVDRLRAFQRGADDYVHRPIVYEELLGSVSTTSFDPVSTSRSWQSRFRSDRSYLLKEVKRLSRERGGFLFRTNVQQRQAFACRFRFARFAVPSRRG